MLSALEQGYTNKEIIFVDNGSTDGSYEAICEDFQQVTTHNTGENLGCPQGRNVGASLATGDLLFFLENDGVWASSSLVSDVVTVMQSNSDVGALYTSVRGYKSGIDDPAIDCYEKFLGRRIGEHELLLASSFRGGAAVIRRSLFESLDGFPSDFLRQGEERFLSLGIYNHGYKVVYWPKHCLRHKGSDYRGKSAAVRRFSCENELKVIIRLYPQPLYRQQLLAKILMWGVRFAKARDIQTYNNILRQVPAWLRERRNYEQISLETANFVEAMMFGKLTSYDACGGSVTDMERSTPTISPVIQRLKRMTYRRQKFSG